METLSNVELVVDYARDVQDAAKLVQRALVQYREKHRGPVLVATQAPSASCRLQHEMPILNDFPCVEVPPHLDDSRCGRASEALLHNFPPTACCRMGVLVQQHGRRIPFVQTVLF